MQKRKGFTILEVLITVVILSVALLALSSLQTAAVGTNYTSHRMTIATILAQDKVEELQSLSWTDSQLADTNPTNFSGGDFSWASPETTADHADGAAGVVEPTDGGVASQIDENGNPVAAGAIATEGYYRFWNVADNTPAAKMKTLSVRVQWSEGRPKSVTLNTVISE